MVQPSKTKGERGVKTPKNERREITMTLIELQKILGDRIRIAIDKTLSQEERRKEAEISQTIASLAKQMINNADIVIRADRLRAEGKVQNDNISKMIGVSDEEQNNG